MPLEHDDNAPEPKDYSRYLWFGILGLFAVMICLILIMGERQPVQSEVRAKHILVKFDSTDPADKSRALERIKGLRERLANGESFEKLARENSDDEASAGRGGDLGPMQKGKFQEQFENYVWTAPVGELSGIVQTSYGFHLIVVVERHLSAGDAYEEELEKRVTGGGEASSAPASPAPANP